MVVVEDARERRNAPTTDTESLEALRQGAP